MGKLDSFKSIPDEINKQRTTGSDITSWIKADTEPSGKLFELLFNFEQSSLIEEKDDILTVPTQEGSNLSVRLNLIKMGDLV